ncbi:MAG: Nudix family hydrolase [Pontibacterium sp.]
MAKIVHVAAAAIIGENGKLFLAKRPSDKHQGGLWEFPGGKVEPGEPVLDALSRELYEELGINVVHAEPLIKVPYHYPDKSVLLDIFKVTAFTGQAWGKEGQETKWVKIAELDNYTFPAANVPIVDAISLPSSLAITPEDMSLDQLDSWVDRVLSAGAEGVMLRLPNADNLTYRQYAARLMDKCEGQHLVVLNTDVATANALGADGLQLSQTEVAKLSHRLDFKGRWLGVSCHNEQELSAAQDLGANFVTLSPVAMTKTHPQALPLGWEKFASLVEQARLPVFALGGMSSKDLSQVKALGAQGIAAIRGWL